MQVEEILLIHIQVVEKEEEEEMLLSYKMIWYCIMLMEGLLQEGDKAVYTIMKMELQN